MNGTDIKHMCDGYSDCEKCPIHNTKCKKWKEDLKKLTEFEPWELDKFIELSEDIAYYKNY